MFDEYKEKLEKSMKEYMDLPLSERTSTMICGMAKCWLVVDEICEKMHRHHKHDEAEESYLSESDAAEWMEHLINEDGTHGARWSITQTSAVAEGMGIRFQHISDYEWNAAMNMIYSDYFAVAKKYSVDVPEFYACLAKAFLFDKDAPDPKAKIGAYYHGIVD